jgi:hypothetical protein
MVADVIAKARLQLAEMGLERLGLNLRYAMISFRPDYMKIILQGAHNILS